MNTKEIDKRVIIERDRLAAMYEDLEESKRSMIQPLIERAAFMRVLLEDLEDEIRKTGAVERYQNGEHQSGMKQSSALQAYNATLKVYASVIKTLSLKVPQKRVLTFAERLMKEREEERAREAAKSDEEKAEERAAMYEESRREAHELLAKMKDYEERKARGELTPEEQEEERKKEESRQEFQEIARRFQNTKPAGYDPDFDE